MARKIVRTHDFKKKNLLINGDMSLAQRGASIQTLTTVATGEYYLDRWRCAAFAVTTPQISQSSLPAAFPGRPEIDRALRMVGTAQNVGTQVYAEQRIESIRLHGLDEDKISVGFYVWVSNFTNIRIQVATADAVDNFSTVTSVIDVDIPVTADSTWQFVKLEDIDIPNKNGVVVVYYADTPANATGAFDTYMTQIMVNQGSVAEAFRLMGSDANEELKLCQRYFCKTYELDEPVGSTSSTGYFQARANGTLSGSVSRRWNFPVTMRANPTAAIYSTATGSSGLMYNSGTLADVAAIVFAASETGIACQNNAALGINNYLLWHVTADAEL